MEEVLEDALAHADGEAGHELEAEVDKVERVDADVGVELGHGRAGVRKEEREEGLQAGLADSGKDQAHEGNVGLADWAADVADKGRGLVEEAAQGGGDSEQLGVQLKEALQPDQGVAPHADAVVRHLAEQVLRWVKREDISQLVWGLEMEFC